MIVVTVGGGFLDIDGLGAGVAYAELLTLLGKPAAFICTGRMNASITTTIRNWELPLKTEYGVNKSNRFVVVDNSAPKFLEPFVAQDKIDEIIDHHLGNEAYWQERGVKTDIEFVGACCTQIYERWVRANKLGEMSALSARLLTTGILDNTLNLKASVTTQRDKKAYAELSKIGGLSGAWPDEYFAEVQVYIETHLSEAIKNDTKFEIQYPGYETRVTISQLVVWDGKKLLGQKDKLLVLTELYGTERSINIVSISEGKNYFLTPSVGLRGLYERILGVCYEGLIATSDRLWLRKEIMKQAIEHERI